MSSLISRRQICQMGTSLGLFPVTCGLTAPVHHGPHPPPGSTSAAWVSQNVDQPCGSLTLCWRPAGMKVCVQCVSHTLFTGEQGA